MDIKKLLFKNLSFRQTIFKNTFWLILSEIVSKLLFFILLILIARYLGVKEYGVFSFVFAFVSFFSIFVDSGFNILIVREVVRDKSLIKNYTGNIITIKLILGVIIFIVVMAMTQLLAETPAVRALIYLATLWMIGNSFITFLQSVFRVFEKMQYEALSKIIYFTSLFLIAGLVLWQDLGIRLLISSYVATMLLSLIITLILVRKRFVKFQLKIDFDLWKVLFQKAWPFIFSGAFFIIYFKIDTIMLGILSTNAEVGIYSAAYKIYAGVFIIPEMITQAFFPKLARAYKKDKKELKKLFFYFKNTLIIISILLFALIFSGSDFIISLAYGIEFHDAILILKILSTILLFRLFTYIYGWFLTSTDEQKRKVKFQAFCAFLNVILNYFLIIKYQAIGAAVATLITELTLLLLYYVCFKKKWRAIYNKIH